MQFRQGDVFLERVAALPKIEMAEVKTEGRIVLAYGEVTGHAHAIYPDAGVLPAKLWDAGAERFLQVMSNHFYDFSIYANEPTGRMLTQPVYADPEDANSPVIGLEEIPEQRPVLVRTERREGVLLRHEEHGAIPLEAGVYRVSKFGIGTQREYSPEEIRSVAD